MHGAYPPSETFGRPPYSAFAFKAPLIMAGRWLLTISDKEQGPETLSGKVISRSSDLSIGDGSRRYAHSGNVVDRFLRCPGLLALQPRDFSRSRTTSSARLSVRSPR